MKVEVLKTADVQDNPKNPRQKLGDLRSLTQSIERIGLQQPISVREIPGGKYVVIVGARRLAACKKLGLETITCVVRTTEENDQLAAIAENTAREDLSVDELVDALVGLEGLEMSDEEIAQALAIESTSVPSARLVAKASKKNRAALRQLSPESRQFTLEESAALIRFADQPARMEVLADIIQDQPDQLPHVIARYEAEDAREGEIQALRDSMAGATEIEPFSSWRRPAGVASLNMLTTGDGKRLTVSNHKDCPYRAFTLEGSARFDHRELKIVHLCQDWAAAGHKASEKFRGELTSSKGQTDDPEKRQVALEERRKVVANNKLWGPATKVREEWTSQFGLRKELNLAAKAWVLNEIIRDPQEIGQLHFTKGEERPVWVVEAAFVLVWRQLVQARETELQRSTWRASSFSRPRLERYFKMLQGQGYPISEIESVYTSKEDQSAA